MVKNVVILGAGASASANAPLMNNFLDVAEDLLAKGSFGEAEPEIKRVFTLIAELQKVYAKSNLDLNNIESLFGIIEMAGVLKQLGEIPPNQIPLYRDSIVKLIVYTIQKQMKFRFRGINVLAPPCYDLLLGYVKDNPGDTAFVTFNYDVGLDTAIHRAGFVIDYGLESPPSRHVKLFKLHGSFNWGIEENTKNIVPYTPQMYLSDLHVNQAFKENGETTIDVSSYLFKLTGHLGKGSIRYEKLPLIIPPTWNKTQYHGQISNVWAAAAQALSQAQNILVIGYSLSSADSFFRYLFALGTLGSTRIRRFWVMNTDVTGGKTEQRFRTLLGRAVEDRFTYFEKRFPADKEVMDRFFKKK